MAQYGLTVEDGRTQVWYIDDNHVTGGAEAVNDAMRHIWWAKPFTHLYSLPVIRQIQDRVYRWVANNRHHLPGSSAVCEIEPK